jgi:hypothetical protein
MQGRFNVGFSAETIRVMAREIYGIELSEARAAEIAKQATGLCEAARQAGRGSDFNEELLSARQALTQASEEGGTS